MNGGRGCWMFGCGRMLSNPLAGAPHIWSALDVWNGLKWVRRVQTFDRETGPCESLCTREGYWCSLKRQVGTPWYVQVRVRGDAR